MAVNHLLLTDVKKEEEADDLLASLTSIAYKTPQSEAEPPPVESPKKKAKEKKSNRFFYSPTMSFDEEVTKRKKRKGNRHESVVTILDREVEDRRKTYSKELPKTIKDNIENVREFFLQEIGPLALAAQAGTTQATQVMQRTLNTEINTVPFVQFENMVSKASSIKMARFVAKYLGLPARTVETLLQTAQPAQPKEVYFMGGSPWDERRRPKEKPEPQKE
jgi:hypothetical protein